MISFGVKYDRIVVVGQIPRFMKTVFLVFWFIFFSTSGYIKESEKKSNLHLSLGCLR